MRRWGVYGVAGLVVVLVVVNAASWVAAPPGDSHDGRNAGVWGLSARALLDDPIGSRLGGVQPTGDRYANHPPAIVVAAAVTTFVTGGHPLGLRLPAILATATAAVLLVVLLRRAGLPDVAVAAGVVMGGTAPMLLTYGTMLDTPVLALPVGAAVSLVGLDVRHGRHVRTAVLAGAGLAAGLISWQAVLLTALVALTVAVGTPVRERGLRAAAALVAGAVVGSVLSLGWAWWAYGGLDGLFDTFARRQEAVPDWGAAQRVYLGSLFGPVLLGAVAAAVAVVLVRRRHRSLLGAPLLAVVGWSVLFREAAAVHDYWNFLGVLVAVIAVGVVVEAGIDAVRRWVPSLAPLVGVALAVAVVVVAGAAVVHPSEAERTTVAGVPGGRAAEALAHPASPAEVAVWADEGSIPAGAPWAAWTAHGSAPPADAEALVELSRSDPDAPVMLVIPATATVDEDRLDEVVARDGRYLIVRASIFGPA
jgi:4-amino-4-deoxy-L-arabinose transferase-like glycosyltransferase